MQTIWFPHFDFPPAMRFIYFIIIANSYRQRLILNYEKQVINIE